MCRRGMCDYNTDLSVATSQQALRLALAHFHIQYLLAMQRLIRLKLSKGHDAI